MCIQVNFDKPLIKLVKVVGVSQPVQYEGISSLCFLCGRISHKVDYCPYTSWAPVKVGEENVEGNTPLREDQVSAETDNFGPWIIVEKNKHANRRVNSTLAHIANSGQRSLTANAASPPFSPLGFDPVLPAFEESEGKRKIGSSSTKNGSILGQKESNKSIVKPNLTEVTKPNKGPSCGQKAKALSRGPFGSKGTRQYFVSASKHYQSKKSAKATFVDPLEMCVSMMKTSPAEFKGFTMGGSTEGRLVIGEGQMMSNHEEKSSSSRTKGMENDNHRTSTTNSPNLSNPPPNLNNPPVRKMENQVIVASNSISKANLQRIEPVPKIS